MACFRPQSRGELGVHRGRRDRKADAALFHFKVMDFYQRKIATASAERWWRIICGTTPTTATARTAAVSLGLLVCDPSRLPLPGHCQTKLIC